jgi:hypothetical protein
MRSTTESLVDGKWVSNPPTYHGQRIKVTTYFDDGTFGSVETTFDGEPVADMRMTKQKFKLRLTQAERITIREAAKENPVVFDFQDLLDSGSHADLLDDVLIKGLSAMESLGLIAQGRAQEILSAPIQDNERYRGDL